MPPRPLVMFPDPRLRRPADPVTAFDATLAALAEDLLATLRAAPGIGITAPHVGVPSRVVVTDLPGDQARIFVNPRVVWADEARVRHSEGSVSMPGVDEEVERPARVRVAYQALDGTPAELAADGLMAVCLQHEIDQLDGVFWIDRLSRLRRERVVKRYDKARRG